MATLICGLAFVLALAGVMPTANSTAVSDAASATVVRAQAGDTPVRIILDRVSPSVAKPGQTVSLVGSIENVSKSSVTLDSARASTQERALDTPEALDAWLAGRLPLTAAEEVGRRAIPQRLMPGESVDFAVTIPAGNVAPPFAFASLPLLVDIRADDDTILGSVATILPWYAGSSPETQLQLSWVVPLTVPPEPALTSTPGLERTAAWLDVIGADSPARAWLDGLERSEATFMVDPALLVPLASAADISAAVPDEQTPLPTEPSVTDPSTGESPTEAPAASESPLQTSTPPEGDAGTEKTGAIEGDAEGTDDNTLGSVDLEDLVQLPDDPTRIQEAEAKVQNRLVKVPADQMWWLAVGDPDLAALIDIGVDTQVVDDVLNADLPPSVLKADTLVDRGRTDVAWPLWSQFNAPQLDAMRGLRPESPLSTLLVPRSTFADASGIDRQPAAVRDTPTGDLTLLGYDERLSDLVSTMPTADADADAEQIQAVLGYTLARYQRTPADPGAVVVAPERNTAIEADSVSNLAAALRSAPWVTQVSAATLLDDASPTATTSDTAESSLTRTSLPDPAPSPLSLTEIDRIEGVRDTLGQLSGILPNSVAVQRWQPVLNGLYSTRWRSDPEEWAVPLTELESQVEIVVDGVKVNPTAVNFLAREGLIQITISNDLPVAVKDLQLTLAPGNGRLRIIDQPAPVTIGAKSRANVQFRARAVAAGEVPVEATVSTPSGLTIGETQEVDVQVRPTGIWIYWVLGGVAGVILILGLTRALRRPAPSAGQESNE